MKWMILVVVSITNDRFFHVLRINLVFLVIGILKRKVTLPMAMLKVKVLFYVL